MYICIHIMGKKPEIVICGCGHGGLIAGAYLAQKGLNVTIFERKARKELGYDWTDNIPLEIFEAVGLSRPETQEYFRSSNYQFVSEISETLFTIEVPEEKREIAMERTLIWKKLVDNALESGVNIQFETPIIGPFISNGIVTGVQLKDQTVHADLIIDAAGINSPIRAQLPPEYNIPPKLARGEFIYAYRAFYKLNTDQPYDSNAFKVYLKFAGLMGIAWFRIVKDYCDVLFAKMDPFEEHEIDQLLLRLQKVNPGLSLNKIRGGCIEQIPSRHPFSLLIGPNYALVGDSACMTIPLNGSGIANAMLAGKILGETIEQAIRNKKIQETPSEIKFPIETLWPYQVRFFHEKGAFLTQNNYLKYYLLGLTPKDIDYIFRHQLIMPSDIENSLNGNGNKIDFLDLLHRLYRGFSRLDILLNLKAMVDFTKQISKTAQSIPVDYEKTAVSIWIKKISHYFKAFEENFQNNK